MTSVIFLFKNCLICYPFLQANDPSQCLNNSKVAQLQYGTKTLLIIMWLSRIKSTNIQARHLQQTVLAAEGGHSVKLFNKHFISSSHRVRKNSSCSLLQCQSSTQFEKSHLTSKSVLYNFI